MKHLKMLGLVLATAAALMAFAGPASATTLTSPSGTEYTGEFSTTATSSLLLEAGFAEITCTESTVKGKVESNGGSTASGKITTLSFTGCGESTVDVIANGSLEFESTGGGEAGVYASGMQVTTAIFGVSCVYGQSKPRKIWGFLKKLAQWIILIDSALDLIKGGFLCANPASLSGEYAITSPSELIPD